MFWGILIDVSDLKDQWTKKKAGTHLPPNKTACSKQPSWGCDPCSSKRRFITVLRTIQYNKKTHQLGLWRSGSVSPSQKLGQVFR